MTRTILWTGILLLAFSPALAGEGNDGEQRDKRRGPPAEALEACAAAVEGDACSFQGRRGETREGTCEAPAEKPLACRPARPPREELSDIQ